MSAEVDVETTYCSNCKKDIAVSNFTMHEMHCRRHLVLCQHCEEPVPRSELDQHFNDVHAKIACTMCGSEFEKDQIDTHMETQCPKRKVPCEYCELEVPQEELAAHLEYCGTRTEACPRCSAYIMQKDQMRHNSSNCTYPPPAPAPAANNTGAGDGLGLPDERAFSGRFDYRTVEFHSSFEPFSFMDMRQALNHSRRDDPFQRAVKDLAASAAAGEREVDFDMHKRASKSGSGSVKRNEGRSRGPSQKNEVSAARKSTTNKKSDLNRQRDAEPAIPPDMDYDTMLAMQLATEDPDDVDPDAHLNELLSSYGKRSRPLVHRNVSLDDKVLIPVSSPESNEFAVADEIMIPCEFCEDTFPAFALVHHQSVCDQLASGFWGQGEDMPSVRNNEPPLLSRWSPSVSRPAIPVINNLGSASPAQEPEARESYHLTDNGDYPFNILEDIMLPCEFCSELLPADSLVQHQAICEGNSSSTPRVMTPAAAQPSSGAGTGAPRSQFFPTSPTRSRQHQPDPTEELLTAIGQRGTEENNPSAPEPRTASKKSNTLVHKQIRPTCVTSAGRHIPASSVRSSQAGGGNEGRPRKTAEEVLQELSTHSRGARPTAHSRGDKPSTRTRHTLDRLLSNEDGSSQETSGSRRKEPQAGPTSVTSRTVMQAIKQELQRSGNRRQSSDQDRSEEGTVDLSGRRQRERDHVFNGPDNTRGQPNQPLSKRSSNR